MSPSEASVKELDEKHANLIVKLVSDIRTGKLVGCIKIALTTVSLLEQIISDSQNTNVIGLCGVLRECGRRLRGALPHEPVPVNMVRRVLRALRDEHRSHANQSEGAGESLQRLVLAASARRSTLGPAAKDLTEPLRDHIAELRNELESTSESISSQAREHVHADELILTYGASELAEAFLRAAAGRRYKLILAEDTDINKSHGMAARLSVAGVPVTVVSSSSVCAVMPRVNKVVVWCRAGLAGGALLAAPGLRAVTTAARHYSVPVVALAPLYALSPEFARDRDASALLAPHVALPYRSGMSGASHVLAPLHDYVPPEHVTVIVTNQGGSSPSYIYRLLSELYDPADYNI